MSKPVPDIREMLDVAEGCGLNTLEEAYSNYLNHYDMFFYIPEYGAQMKTFTEQCIEKGFTETFDSRLKLKELTIEQARSLL